MLCIAVTLVVLKYPHLLVNDKTVNYGLTWGAKHLAEAGYNVTWSKAKIWISSDSFFKKKLHVYFENACLKPQSKNEDAEGSIDFCLKLIEAQAAADLSGFKPRITEVGPVRVDADEMKYSIKPAHKSKSPERTDAKPFQIPFYLKNARILPIIVHIPDLEVDDAGKSYHAKISLDSEEIKENVKFYLSLVAHETGLPLKLSLRLYGEGGPQRFQASLNADLVKFSKQSGDLRVRDCVVDLGGQGANAHFKLRCPIEADLPKLPVNVSNLDFPKKIAVSVDSEATGEFLPPDFERPWQGWLKVGLVPFKTSTFSGNGHLQVSYSGKLAELETSPNLRSDLNLKLSSPHFEELVRRLKDGAWAVPAPFNVLTGSVELIAGGVMQSLSGEYPFRLQSRLSSVNQKLDTDTDGKLIIALASNQHKQADVRAEVNTILSNIRLELPKLDLAAPPRFFPDKRVKSFMQRQKELADLMRAASPSIFHYHLHVSTPADHSLHILSNRAKAPIPIQVDLSMSDSESIAGNVRVGTFPLEFFRQDASVDHFNLVLKNPSSQGELDGDIKVEFSDIIIHVIVQSTIEKPQIRLQSDPPLPENQILAALIFHKSLQDLDPDETSSVGNTSAALREGAIGIASLFALASTPIESVGYDPTTKQISAKVKLGSGTSLNLGSDTTGASQVGIRKRLSKHWTIETNLDYAHDSTVGTGGGGGGATASTFLEWSARY